MFVADVQQANRGSQQQAAPAVQAPCAVQGVVIDVWHAANSNQVDLLGASSSLHTGVRAGLL